MWGGEGGKEEEVLRKEGEGEGEGGEEGLTDVLKEEFSRRGSKGGG